MSINPNSASVHYYMGNILDDLGKKEEAVECYRTALKNDERDVKSCYNLGLTLYDLEKNDEAIE